MLNFSKKTGLFLVLFATLTCGLKSAEEPSDLQAAVEQEVKQAKVAVKSKGQKFLNFIKPKHRKEVAQTVVTSGVEFVGKVFGGFMRSHLTDTGTPKIFLTKDVSLLVKLFFCATIPEIAKACARLGFDFLDEAKLSKAGEQLSDEQKAGLLEKLFCHALINTTQTVVGFSSFEGDSTTTGLVGKIKPGFGPGKKAFLGNTARNLAFSAALRSIDNNHYKDYIGEDSVFQPVCDAGKSLLDKVDCDDMVFLNITNEGEDGKRGVNKLFTKFICKSSSGFVAKFLSKYWAKRFAEDGKTAKYNRFVKSVISAILMPLVAEPINAFHPTTT